MTELAVLAAFAAALFLCIGLDFSILYALIFGFFLFFAYGLYRGHAVSEMLRLAFSGIKTVKSILITFVLIGVITAVWRAGGTIPFIVYYSTKVCSPHAMILITFLLCCLVSFLTGTSFGTAATMGVICVTMANSMGIPVLYTGGAVLAGSFFGDRCSPMSTSALLVSTLTETSLFGNIRTMMKTSLLPFVLTCCIYTLAGLCFNAHSEVSGVQQIFKEFFVLHPAVLIPAAVIIVFSLFKTDVKITMIVSALCGAAVSVFIQGLTPRELLRIAVFGYHPSDSEVCALLSGGGILSMTKVFFIVCLSSSYAGMFDGTGLLDGIRQKLAAVSQKAAPFGSVLLTSIITGMISCNQTLTIMLTHQLCGSMEKDHARMASYLENTAVVIAPLVPWSIAGAVPLTSAGAPMVCILTACYLYLLPICNYMAILRDRRTSQAPT